MTFRSGFVAIVGRANTGKSTLLNALVGEKVSIVSEKPHTTRHKLLGVLNGDGFQAALLDTPGYLRRGRDRLDAAMKRHVRLRPSPKPTWPRWWSSRACPATWSWRSSSSSRRPRRAPCWCSTKSTRRPRAASSPVMERYAEAYPFERLVPVSAPHWRRRRPAHGGSWPPSCRSKNRSSPPTC